MLGEVLGGVSLLGFGGAGGGIEVCGVGKALWPSKGLSGEALERFLHGSVAPRGNFQGGK